MPRVQQHYDLVVLARQPHTLGQYRAVSALVGAYRRLMPYRLRDPEPVPVGGHYGVTRSLVIGLGKIGVRFAYEPDLARTSAESAIVLASPGSLGRAMQWKRAGGCRLLFAGPNIVDDPGQLDGIIRSPELVPVVASDKMRTIFERKDPLLKGRVRVWPAGVDADYWRAEARGQRDTLLIYNKRMPELAASLVEQLGALGMRVEVIHYGERREEKYRPHQFRAALDRSYACVFLTYNEPQGIAASEAWSMDVPTLVHRVESLSDEAIVPYMTPTTGAYWTTFEQLLSLLQSLSIDGYAPRQWVLKHMTDAVCAQLLMDVVRAA